MKRDKYTPGIGHNRADATAAGTVTTDVVGKGMTARERTTLTRSLAVKNASLSDLSALSDDDTFGPLQWFDEARLDWEEELHKVCQSAGCEWNGHIVRRVDRGKKGRLIEKVFLLDDGDAIPPEFEAYSGTGWYLVRILQLQDMISENLKAQQPIYAVQAGIELGALQVELALKENSEREWVSGTASRKGGEKGVRAKQGWHDTRDKFFEAYAQYLARDPREPFARRYAAEVAGVGERQARRLKKNYEKNRT